MKTYFAIIETTRYNINAEDTKSIEVKRFDNEYDAMIWFGYNGRYIAKQDYIKKYNHAGAIFENQPDAVITSVTKITTTRMPMPKN